MLDLQDNAPYIRTLSEEDPAIRFPGSNFHLALNCCDGVVSWDGSGTLVLA
jgi:hypothetical protein